MASVLQLEELGQREHLLSDSVQQQLASWNHDRLEPRLPAADWSGEIRRDAQMLNVQGRFLELLRQEVREAAEAAPHEPQAFVNWFEDLEQTGAGQRDPLF